MGVPQVDDLAHLTALDRLLHTMAFSSFALQRDMADLEDVIYARQMRAIAVERPVFITGLPRAGTTILLECLSCLPEFCSHTYRHMPFLLCPMLWASISRPFYAHENARERPHGDGLAITHDSPEAFEEILWQSFWREKYHDAIIECWSERDRNRAFEDFLKRHIRKLILLARRDGKMADRYVSKNNANIARLDLLPKIFPDAVILVPFRDPLCHAQSLLMQERNFKQRQTDDPFVRNYMRACGHLEFGSLLHRIALAPPESRPDSTDTLGYWLRYWTGTYQALLRLHPDARFLDYDRMCTYPEDGALVLHRAMGTQSLDDLRRVLSRLRAPTLHSCSSNEVDNEALDHALAVHAELRSRAINAI